MENSTTKALRTRIVLSLLKSTDGSRINFCTIDLKKTTGVNKRDLQISISDVKRTINCTQTTQQ